MNVFEINNAIAEIENKDLDPEVLVDTIKSLELTRDQKLDGAAGLKEIRTEHHILKPRNYRDSVIVEEIRKLPIDYVVEEKTIKTDKKKLYEDLKAGKEITGAHLKANRRTLIK